jgi:membrane protein
MTRGETLHQIHRLLGPSVADLVVSLTSNSSGNADHTATNSLVIVLLFFGASSVFAELRSSLNIIWGVREANTSWYTGLIEERLVAFAMVAGLGVVLTISLLVSTVAALVVGFLSHRLAIPKLLLHVSNLGISFVITATVFCLIFRFVPAIRISWRDSIVGALVTTALFDLVRVPIALYLSHAHVGSAYGAAGSLVAFLCWVYLSAQVFYLGGEFTTVYSKSYGTLAKKDASR